MPLVSPKKIFKFYKRGCGAIGAFNIYNLEAAEAIIQAAEKTKKPVIVQISEGAGKKIGLECLANIVKALANNSKAKITYHLDHGKDIVFVKKAISLGFPSVMIDGSKFPFKKNVQVTKEIVSFAKKYGTWVEGEIGAVAGSESEAIDYTDPCEAKEFVRQTGVNSLAVSIGNIHGIPAKTEIDLNLDVLKRIAQTVKIPLVLHGGSGTSVSMIKKAVKLGIAKININTELKKACIEAIEDFVEHREGYDMYELYNAEVKQAQKLVEEKIKIF